MYIPRNLEEKVQKYLNSPEIIAIVGPRQCGKTTLLKHIYSKYNKQGAFLTFEEPQILAMFENNTSDFIELYVKNKKALFIDEFQYSKNGGKILKQIYDQHKLKIFITGSSSIDLTIKALKYLTGRIFAFELFPFDFREFLKAKDKNLCNFYEKQVKIIPEQFQKTTALPFGEETAAKLNRYFEEYLIYGGYPRVVIADNPTEKIEVLKNIYSTFFLREVKDYLELTDDYKLHNLIKGLSLQVGNLIEYKELTSLSESSFISLKKYLNFLEKAYVCSLVRPFFTNKRKEIVKNPKVFLLDTGLRNCIVGDFRNLDTRPDAGALLETGVFANLKKNNYSLKYWRDKNKREIDFIIEDTSLKIAIEVKMNLNKCGNNLSTNKFLNEHPDFSLIFLYNKGFKQEAKDSAGVTKLPCFIL